MPNKEIDQTKAKTEKEITINTYKPQLKEHYEKRLIGSPKKRSFLQKINPFQRRKYNSSEKVYTEKTSVMKRGTPLEELLEQADSHGITLGDKEISSEKVNGVVYRLTTDPSERRVLSDLLLYDKQQEIKRVTQNKRSTLKDFKNNGQPQI